MSKGWYKHPQRHPKNVEGPFYSLTEDDPKEANCHSACLDCDIPQHEAKGLIKSLDDEDGDTYFIRQPQTPDEISNAIASTEVCCVAAIRYGGVDPGIIIRTMAPELCDFYINEDGEVCLNHT